MANQRRTACALLTVITLAAARHRPLLIDPSSLPRHPRLILTDGRLSEIQAMVNSGGDAASLHSIVEQHGQALITKPEGGDGGAWDSVYTLGFLHRYDCLVGGHAGGNCSTAWGDAGIKNLLAVAANRDFCNGCGGNCTAISPTGVRTMGLCTANLGTALGLGFDWFYNAMSEAQRGVVQLAITQQILDVYAEGLSAAFVGDYLYEATDNFNSAVNSGVIIAALAALDAPSGPAPMNWTATYAADSLALAHISLLRGMSSFTSDGGQGEGPTYYAFGAQHVIAASDALFTVTGSYHGLDAPALASARFLMHHFTPTGEEVYVYLCRG